MKRTRSVMLAAILLLSAMVVFAGTAAAEYQVEIYGDVTYPDGSGVQGVQVEITKELGSYGSGNWESVGVTTTDETGYYTMTSRWYDPIENGVIEDGYVVGKYCIYIGGQLAEEDFIYRWQWDGGLCKKYWSYRWDQTTDIPEFATIAIPAIALLGLFAFSRRKQKK